ncbi:family 1 glycosylhydrolase, partial [Saccharothrix sp. MB29]|nr:family 1 glycosylhydrolase [Saccharothrix sp. MB29]
MDGRQLLQPHPRRAVRRPGVRPRRPAPRSARGRVPARAGEVTGFGWEVDASSFTALLERLGRDVDVPLVVTENGSAFPDEVVDGEVDDVERTRYLVDHLRAVHRAV